MKVWLIGISLLTGVACAERNFSSSPTTAKTVAPKEHSEENGEKAAPLPNGSKTIDDSSVSQPIPGNNTILEGSKKTIEFGSNEVYRIGNGQASDSSCLSTLDSYNLSGTTYFFDFEVINDETAIDLTIGRLCGVDTNSNILSLVKDGMNLQRAETLPRRVYGDKDNAYAPYRRLKLDKGLHSLRIESQLNPNRGSNGMGDNDDFIVGKINIKADKEIKAVGVRTK